MIHQYLNVDKNYFSYLMDTQYKKINEALKNDFKVGNGKVHLVSIWITERIWIIFVLFDKIIFESIGIRSNWNFFEQILVDCLLIVVTWGGDI